MRPFMHLLCSGMVLVAAVGCKKAADTKDEAASPANPGVNVAPMKTKKPGLQPPPVPVPPSPDK
jgi:hypothetical protein